ncbi:MAG: putative manganese transporter [Pseudomonadota bacterium]
MTNVFVAATLALVYGSERIFRFDLGEVLAKHQRWQIPIAALLGALPGCGGAIIVVTQYVRGQIGFAALIAVLTATMGDAAFLLLARDPLIGLLVFVVGIVVGSITGYLVEATHGRAFMRQATSDAEPERELIRNASGAKANQVLHPIWLGLMLPGVLFAIPMAFLADPNTWFGPLAAIEPVTLLGFAGGVLAILMWSLHFTGNPANHYPGANPGDLVNEAMEPRCPPKPPILARVINDTNFVSVWVIAAFLVYELAVHFSGADIAGWFVVWAPITPLIAALVGFLPGCGPQIVVTTLYLSGAIPLGALMANALSNDGDALFPAIALAPRAAVVATLYSGIPALIVGYAFYFLV